MTPIKSPSPQVQDAAFFDDFPIDKLMDNSQPAAPSDAIKDIFTKKDIMVKTDLSARLISKITRAYYMCELLDMPEITVILDNFITLRVSKDRLSRKEFVDALSSKLAAMSMGGMQQGIPLRQQFGK